ncbi:MAG: hypothetical protein WAO74_02005 [Polaribacter sp.]|uniref:hypothetical protein n=1 Tax=Polaribacter sp. TaxID=1920175 RepID=UPI003BAEB1AD
MKTLKFIIVIAIFLGFLNTNAQEKKIKFNKGTLKICSSKNFQIQGYDGDEVIIKSMHEKTSISAYSFDSKNNINGFAYGGNKKRIAAVEKRNEKTKDSTKKGKWEVQFGVNEIAYIDDKKTNLKNKGKVFFINNDDDKKKGLKKLGKNNENSDFGIYFTIEEKDGELIFKDKTEGQLVMISNERYEIKIPNSIKLNWQTNSCNNKSEAKNQYVFYNSQGSSLSNFDGEVSISSTLNNTKLKDVTGPVSINTLGGNVTIEFDKKTPKFLYSIYSNNGFIDITIPETSDVNIDAIASDIFSDINFKVDEEKEQNNLQQMKLKLKSGKVKMKLNANLGNIYLRKK